MGLNLGHVASKLGHTLVAASNEVACALETGAARCEEAGAVVAVTAAAAVTVVVVVTTVVEAMIELELIVGVAVTHVVAVAVVQTEVLTVLTVVLFVVAMAAVGILEREEGKVGGAVVVLTVVLTALIVVLTEVLLVVATGAAVGKLEREEVGGPTPTCVAVGGSGTHSRLIQWSPLTCAELLGARDLMNLRTNLKLWSQSDPT